VCSMREDLTADTVTLVLPVEKVDTDMHSLSETIVPPKDKNEHAPEEVAVADAVEDTLTPEVPAETTTEQSERALPLAPEPEPGPEPEQPPAEFVLTAVHLSDAENPQTTKHRQLFYLIVWVFHFHLSHPITHSNSNSSSSATASLWHSSTWPTLTPSLRTQWN
jgi:hypothetical protein